MEKQPNASLFPSVRPYIFILTKGQTPHLFKTNNDFQYVVQRHGKAKICFGSSQERKKCGVVSRFGVEFSSDSLPNLTPGKYYVPSSMVQRKPESLKGTVIGGRTSYNEYPIINPDFPTPATYVIPDGINTPTTTFSSASLRFPNNYRRNTIVGPGYYDINLKLQRKPKFMHSFGGKRRLIPAIEMKCGPFNHDICEQCKETPVGDYWSLTEQTSSIDPRYETRTIYICRACHTNEKKNPLSFTKGQLLNFKKIRDCSQVHFHDGCEARLLLVPPRDIEKIQEKEAYLSLYFP